jgi:hypothetical protein
MKLHSIVATGTLILACATAPAAAESAGRGSQGSETLSAGSGMVVWGSASILAGSGMLVVAGLEAAGESVHLVLKGASEAGEVSIRVSGELAAAASLAVGSVVVVTAEATGYALSAAGKLIAFVPNEVGRSLLYHGRYGEGS